MKFIDYLKQPATIRKIVAAIFILWTGWASLNYRVEYNDSRLAKLEAMNIGVVIVQMQTDIARIRRDMESDK